MEDRKITRLDWLIIIILALAGIMHVTGSMNKPVHPAEDAAMLMRYSINLADGHGIVWNIGQAPVDGATDFLYMILLAGLYSLGMGLETAPILVGGVSHLLTVLLVYAGIRCFFQGGRLAAVLPAVFLLFGSGLLYAEASFGTPFFALFCTLSWLTAQYTIEKPQSTIRALFFSLSCLLMGLIRPEGVLIAGFMLMAVMFKLGWKASTRVLQVFTGLFLFLGGAYFLWHWSYFGHPLPNPFYKKGGGSLYFHSLQESWKAVLELGFPFWLVYAGGIAYLVWAGLDRLFGRVWWNNVRSFLFHLMEAPTRLTVVNVLRVIGGGLLIVFTLGLFHRSSNLHEALVMGRYSANYSGLLLAILVTGLIALFSQKWLPIVDHPTQQNSTLHPFTWSKEQNDFLREMVFILIPVTGFILMWVLLSNEMNYLWRFQYPILPVILISWPLILDHLRVVFKIPEPESWHANIRGPVVVAGLLLAIGLTCTQLERWKINYQSDGRFDVAEFLARFTDKRYTIATTEAGLLPLYSGWQALDTWGLNDAWIAHNGGITGEYLSKMDPEIIMFHADFSPLNPKEEPGDKWGEMTMTLDTYARENGYTLAAVYGESPVDTHYYYVRPDFPESSEIVDFIRSLNDGGYHYGSRTFDFNRLMWKKE